MPLRKRTSGFTLIEILVGVMLSGLILTAAYSSFQGIMKSQIRLGGVIDIQRNLFYLNEKMASLIHGGGTLDYEEYFNRRMLGYAQGFVPKDLLHPEKGSSYTFSTISKYGNGDVSGPKIYFCGKDSNTLGPDACIGTNAVYEASSTPGKFIEISQPHSLAQTQQAYRQYRELGFNYAPSLPSSIKLPAIFPTDGTPPTSMPKMNSVGLPELYLIKKLPDGSYERTYFRHVYEEDPNYDYTKNPCTPPAMDYCIGKIQMTRLVSCDNLDKTGAADKPDGTIDAWLPQEDFTKSGTPALCTSIDSITDIKTANDDLLWVDVSSPDMNITTAYFLPSPLKIPSLMSGTGEAEPKSPTIQMHLEVKLSESVQRRGLLGDESNTPRMLITTFDLADI